MPGMRRGFRAGLALLACVGAVPATAQQGVMESDFEPVSYAEVLENPDDVDINIRYARTQIEKGNLNAASSALSRILLKRPGLDRVRLLYAIVLYRMEDLSQARQEFIALKQEGDLKTNEQQLVDRYLSAIRRDRDTFTGTARIGAGVHYDSNRNAHPDADSFRVVNRVIQAPQDENDDVGFLGFGRVQLAHDPGMQRIENIRLTLDGRIDEQREEDQLDLVTGAIAVDSTIHFENLDVTPRAGYRHYRLGEDSFAHMPEVGVNFAHQFVGNTDLTAHAGLNVRYEDFENSSRLPLNDEQSGPLYEVSLGLDYQATQALAVGGEYTFRRKVADQSFHSFVGHRFGADANYVFSNRTHLSVTGEVELDDYQSPDPFISNTTARDDTDSRIRVRYGIPVDMVRQALGGEGRNAITSDLVLSLSGSYLREDSNIRNFEYENWRTMVTISKGLQF